jgi:hypothetical protein
MIFVQTNTKMECVSTIGKKTLAVTRGSLTLLRLNYLENSFSNRIFLLNVKGNTKF